MGLEWFSEYPAILQNIINQLISVMETYLLCGKNWVFKYHWCEFRAWKG